MNDRESVPVDQFDIVESQTDLNALLDSVEQGVNVVLARNGKPVARLVRVDPSDRAQSAAGQLHALRAAIAARSGTVTRSEIKEFRDHGRR